MTASLLGGTVVDLTSFRICSDLLFILAKRRFAKDHGAAFSATG